MKEKFWNKENKAKSLMEKSTKKKQKYNHSQLQETHKLFENFLKRATKEKGLISHQWINIPYIF